MIDSLPKLSISVITFNQEQFIGDCLSSIINQDLPFPYEIVVGDDASTDSTREILAIFEANYPNIVSVIYRDTNIGHTANYIETTKACRGEYIAHIDGDDLMLPHKLQKQVDFLDKHMDCSLVHHLAYLIDEDGKIIGRTKASKATKGDINVLAVQDNIVNSTNMFRQSTLDANFFEMRRDIMLHDWLAHLVKAQYGRVGFIPEPLGSYRVYHRSIIRSARSRDLFRAMLHTLETARNFKGIKQNAINHGKSILFLDRARFFMRQGKHRSARRYLKMAFRCKPLSSRLYRYTIENQLRYLFSSTSTTG